jgi:hypothetical protein
VPLGKSGKDAGSVAYRTGRHSRFALASSNRPARERLRTPPDAAQRAYRALVTLPALRQRVHTYTRLGALPTKILTF